MYARKFHSTTCPSSVNADFDTSANVSRIFQAKNRPNWGKILLNAMKQKLWIAFFLVAALGSGSWTDSPAGAQRPTDGREQLMRLDREFDAATAERGIEGWLAYFEENGSMLPAAGPPHTGQEAIRKALGPTFATPGFSLRWQPTRAEMVIPGVLGYTVGRYTRRTRSPEGKTLVQQGTYFTLWRKQKDGFWKIALDTGSPDGPPHSLD